jgi:hypothetical protein
MSGMGCVTFWSPYRLLNYLLLLPFQELGPLTRSKTVDQVNLSY